MDLHPIAVQIKSLTPALADIGLAGDFQTAMQNLRLKTPAAFVLPGPERAGPNIYIQAVGQLVTMRFSVVLAIQNLRDMQGDAAQTDLDPIRTAVLAALLGWQPGAADSPITFGGGRMLKWADGVLWWQDDYDTTYYVRAT